MPSKRQNRVAEQLHQVLSTLLEFEVSDPRLAGVTVTDVTVDRELMYATVYVTALEGEEARQEVLHALEGATGFLRRELGAQVSLQYVPEIRFRWDETAAQGERIDQLLDSLDISLADNDDPEATNDTT
jgi:ribosome-binding factor A